MFHETTIHDSHRYAPDAGGAGAPARGRGLVAVLIACAALAVAFPSFAKADSVAFARGGDVHLATTSAARRSLASKRIVKLTIGAPGIRSAAMTLKR